MSMQQAYNAFDKLVMDIFHIYPHYLILSHYIILIYLIISSITYISFVT